MEEKTAAAGPRTGCFVCETAIPFLKNIVPQDTREHLRNSRVEFLKAIRTLIDHKITRLSPQEMKGTHVTVE